MISPKFFVEKLAENNIDFFAGVPDSLLKNVCAYLTDNLSQNNNIITANEGGAIALAAGHYLATGCPALVYMQNSGEGNTINPLLSLTDPEVYNIPVLLLVGWRGEPGKRDEPQHIKQGKVTLELLDTIGVKHSILSLDEPIAGKQIVEACEYMARTKEPFALIVQKGTFDEYKLQETSQSVLSLSREKAIETVVELAGGESVIVSTTGMISRELFEYRERMNQSHERDFLTVGSMGHASQIALGIALEKKNRKVFCFDGDGATIMHMGNMAIVANASPSNYVHVVFNNGAHDSVGGQPTVGLQIDLPQIAKSVGYKHVFTVDDEQSLGSVLLQLAELQGLAFIEIKVKKGARKDLGRPTTTPIENRDALMKFLSQSNE